MDRPNIVGQYNKYMGGADKLDGIFKSIVLNFKGKKRYFPFFTNTIHFAVVNTYSLHTALNKNVSLLDFRRNITI